MQELLESEEIIKSSSCSRALFLKTYFLAALLAIAGFYLWRLGAPLLGDSWTPFYAYLLSGLAAIVLLINELRAKAEKLYVTNRRVVFEKGLFSKSYESLPYTRISDTVLEESLSERLFGIGDLLINTPGSQPYALRAGGLPDCEQIQNEIEARMEVTSGEGITPKATNGYPNQGEELGVGHVQNDSSSSIPQEGAETDLSSSFTDKGATQERSKKGKQLSANERQREIKDLKAELSRVNNRLKELEERYEGYDLEKSKYKRMKDSLEARKESIRRKLSKLRS